MVTGVVDGDTLEARLDGRVVRVRLIGIDAPEATTTVECFGREATARVRALVPPGTVVGLEKDVSETDRYGRLLRYLWLADGRMLNEVLVREGYAQAATYPPDVRYQDRLLLAQRRAREAGAGLWSACVAPPPTPTPRATPVAGKAPTGCHPAYPTVCIPPPPPGLDCRDIPHRRFPVDHRYGDPHRFDADRDGIGCE